MGIVIASALFWGMFSYSVLVLGLVSGLAIKMALLFKDRGVLRMELADAERRVNDAVKIAEDAEAMAKRYRNEIKVLHEEIQETSSNLDPAGVADRLKRLLSGEVSKDDNESGEGGKVVSTSGDSD